MFVGFGHASCPVQRCLEPQGSKDPNNRVWGLNTINIIVLGVEGPITWVLGPLGPKSGWGGLLLMLKPRKQRPQVGIWVWV